jgi:signal transduction histidine kinase
MLFRKLAHTGIYEDTPAPMMERIIFSNLVYLIGTSINVVLGILNFAKGYYLFFFCNVAYEAALLAGLWLNWKRHYLPGRLLVISVVFLGILFSGLVQGPVIEIEHYFLPLGVLAFVMFYAEERRYSLFYLVVAILCYEFLAVQTGPLLKFGTVNGVYHFRPIDLRYNQAGYLGLLFVALYSLFKAFNRALKLIDEQRNRLFEERRLASLGEITSSMAHEINSPLAALDIQIYQLKRLFLAGKLTPVETEARIERISQTSKRLSVIVRSLKFLSGRDENDPVSLRPIGTIFAISLEMVEERIQKYGIRLKREIENPEEQISCRAVALSQVFLNLLNNAVDAVKDLPQECRWILIKSEIRNGRLQVSVEDGGAIVSEEVRENLFRSFFTTKPPGKGTGLGLSISRDTVEEHHGTLKFDPECDHTRFVMELPAPGASPLSANDRKAFPGPTPSPGPGLAI